MLRLMKSALGLIMGVSILATAVGACGGDDPTDKPIAIAGSSNAGNGTVLPMGGGSSGGTGGGDLPPGVPLTATDGWVDGMSNTLMIQGAMFEYADPTSLKGPPEMTKDFTGAKACIKGTAAKVDMTSMACTTKVFTPPATDCYGEYWGAAIGLNLNQAIDPTTKMGGAAMPFDASAIKGFAFNITGAMVPTSLRFKVEDASGEYCSPAAKPVKLGPNSFMFEDLIKECWAPKATAANASAAKPAVIKIAWQVVTNAMGAVPFDYCVADLRALQ
jgi:hypothetical protein